MMQRTTQWRSWATSASFSSSMCVRLLFFLRWSGSTFCSVQMNPTVTAFNRHFVNDVKICDDMERRVRFLQDELDKENAEVRLELLRTRCADSCS
jgi:hypothetical protein